MRDRSSGPILCTLVMALILPSWQATGAEGASSLYLPGLVGDILVAVPPEPGLAVVGSAYVQTGSVGTAVLQGAVDLDLDLDIALGIVGATYSFETPWIGGIYTVGLAIPFGYADLEAEILGPGGAPRSVSDDSFNISDIALTPIQINWSRGNFSFRFAETIIAPTGAYDVDKAVNLGRNYWGFDTTAASTYFNEDIGTEVSIAPGILFNSRNDDTNYKTGTEFHLDFTANQFLFESFAIGVRGYFYRQVTGDSGSGAVLGGFKGEAVGVGPGFIWLPKFAEGKLIVQGKWMTDVHSENRFDSDYATLTISWTF
jgi:hypothetical protein